jgi:hypothetical protein
MPGVLKIIRDGSFIGVIAIREEQAIDAMIGIQKQCVWSENPTLPDIGALEEFLYSQETEDEVLKDVGSQPLDRLNGIEFHLYTTLSSSCFHWPIVFLGLLA